MRESLRTVRGEVIGIAARAIWTFASTIVLAIVGGVVLGSAAYWWLGDHSAGVRWLAAALALVESVIVGGMLAGKRSVLKVAFDVLDKLRLGQTVIGAVFDRMIVSGATRSGQALEQKATEIAEKIPLDEAKKLLGNAVRSVQGEGRAGQIAGLGGWGWRLIGARVTGLVQMYLMRRLKGFASADGQVNLSSVKTALEEKVDGVLLDRMKWGAWLWTALFVAALPLGVVVQTWLIGTLGSIAR